MRMGAAESCPPHALSDESRPDVSTMAGITGCAFAEEDDAVSILWPPLRGFLRIDRGLSRGFVDVNTGPPPFLVLAVF